MGPHSIRRPKRNPQHVIMQQVLTDLQNSGTEWAFGKPVDSKVVLDYYNVISHPMGRFNERIEHNRC
jgi:histone acetyltransferase